MENAYLVTPYRFEITRLFSDQHIAPQVSGRYDIDPVTQAQSLKARGLSEVVLADDVIFSGNQTRQAVEILRTCGIHVAEVCAAIGIGAGIERLRASGLLVSCVYTYANVIDEICERDFYPGVPGSGRPMAGACNQAIHYVLPWKNAISWASIPAEHAFQFSLFCLQQTVQLFSEIEHISHRPLRCADLPRTFIGAVPTDRVTDVLLAAAKTMINSRVALYTQ